MRAFRSAGVSPAFVRRIEGPPNCRRDAGATKRRRQRETLFQVLFGNHLKDTAELFESLFAGWHECITSRNSRDFCYPGAIFLTVEHNLVIL